MSRVGRFDGLVRDLGAVPDELFGALHHRILTCPPAWARPGVAFAEAIEGLDSVPLLFPARYPHSHRDARPTPHWRAWSLTVAPLVELTGRRLGLDQPAPAKVLLSRLRAGATVPEHVDLNPSSRVPHKVHIPVVTSPEVHFVVEDFTFALEAGRAYELNNLLRHKVDNRSGLDRVHLVIEVYSSDAHGVAP